MQNRQQLSVNSQLLSTYVKSYYTNMEALIKDNQISELRIFDNSKTETDDSSRKTGLIYSKNMNVSFGNDTLPEMSQAYINWIRSISRDWVFQEFLSYMTVPLFRRTMSAIS